MKRVSISGTVEILATDIYHALPIKVAASDDVVMAGTPLKEDGTATTGTDAVGILLYDTDTARNPNASVVTKGIVDVDKAQSHSGITYDMAVLKAALPGITFRTKIRGTDSDDVVGTAVVGTAKVREG